MSTVLQLTKTLSGQPQLVYDPRVNLRHYQGEEDIEPWLALRRAAFARQRLGIRDWTRDDFEAEFLKRWWWRPEHVWMVESAVPELQHQAAVPLLGTVTLAFRGTPENAMPVVHWLTVHPAWRRRGIARMLMVNLEREAWNLGHRQICLETHADWREAAVLYQALGYVPYHSTATDAEAD